MIAHARITAEADAKGITRLTQLRSESPLLLRSTPDALYLVGGAAGPLGGDDLTLEIDVGECAALTVRSAAASLALPGAAGSRSHLVVTASVKAGGRLSWLPEPTIAATGCNHRIRARVELDPGATLIWREELILGRIGERPGRLSSRMDCELGNSPLLRNELLVGPEAPGWDGPAVLGTAKAVGSILFSSPRLLQDKPRPRITGTTGVLLPLSGPALLFSALADDPVDLRRALDEALLGAP